MGKRKKQTGQGALNNRLKLVVKSGKYCVGWNETLKALRTVWFIHLNTFQSQWKQHESISY